MGLFSRNPNESAFVGGKKHWLDIIKNTGPAELLLWRQPEEDFNTNSHLVVMPGEAAVFVHNGEIEHVFQESGTYVLSTENYPFLSRLVNAFSGGISRFNCVVFFVRNAVSQEIGWGTQSPIPLRDKKWGINTTVRARAGYRVKITDPAAFLEKLIGSNTPYQTADDLNNYFGLEFQGKIAAVLSQYLNSLDCELIGIEQHMGVISEYLQPKLNEILSAYGVSCVNFTLAALDVDLTKYDAIDEFQIASIGKNILAQGDLNVMQTLGDNWARQQSADILHEISTNPGSGGIANASAGLEMGMAAGSVVGTLTHEMFSSGHTAPTPPTSFAGASAASRFAPRQESNPLAAPAAPAPAPAAAPQEDCIQTLQKLKVLLDQGLITQSDYDTKKNEVLSRM